MEDKEYNSKGRIVFYATMEGIKYYKREKKVLLRNFDGEDFMNWFTKPIWDLIDGKSFYEAVDNGSFIDYDGCISDIYVDEYISNLGLNHAGIEQGDFLVDGETFLELCNSHKIEVNWANK